jgi:hypothetical protein
MKLRLYLSAGVVAGGLLLAGPMVFAQAGGAGGAPQTDAAHGKSSIAVDHAGGNGVRRAVGSNAQTGDQGSDAASRKHPANVKYNDFKVQKAAQPETPGTTPLVPLPVDAAKIKSHSNQTNNRAAQGATGTTGSSGPK